MPNPLTRTLRAYADDARSAFRAAPVEVALGVLLAVVFSADARTHFPSGDFIRLAGSVALAFPLVFALSVLAERDVIRPAARWTGTLAVLAACALYGRFLLHDERGADGWRWMLLTAAAVLLLMMTPALPWHARDRRRGWAFAWRLSLRTLGVGLYAVALYGVLAGAVAAVVSLFELRQPDHLYTDLAGAVFFAFAPWVLAGGIHRLSAPPPDGVPLGVSRLGRWLYAPVLVIYLAVLYAYAVKVAATGELPRNLVSPLVIAAGLIGLIGAVFLHPVHEDEEHRGVALLVRAVPALLLPLVPLAAWALFARLGEYGWTEFRYVRLAIVAVIGVLAVLGTIRWIRRRPPLFSTIPAVFAAALLLSALGPWSAPAVSRRDQTGRLRAELRRARVDPLRLPRDTVTVDSAAFQRITGGARYLLDAHGAGALRAVIPGVPDTARAVWEMGPKLGIRRGCTPRDWVTAQLEWGGGVPRTAGGLMLAFDAAEANPNRAAGGVRVTLAGDRLRVAGEGWVGDAELARLLRLVEGAGGGCVGEGLAGPDVVRFPASEALVPLRDGPAGSEHGQLLVTRYVVSGPVERAGQPQQPGLHIRELSGFLILP